MFSHFAQKLQTSPFCPVLAVHRHEKHSEAVLAKVTLRRRAASWLEVSGAGVVLVLLDVLLSILAVLAYIVNTYNISLELQTVSFTHCTLAVSSDRF